MWDYTQRFLGSAEELEENTTYTNADGADQILPARESHTFHAASIAGRVGGGSHANANSAASAEEFIAEEGNKFFERYVLMTVYSHAAGCQELRFFVATCSVCSTSGVSAVYLCAGVDAY